MHGLKLITQLFKLQVDGNWGAWSSFYACTTTCGDGNMTRVRTCDNPEPSNGGKQCSDVIDDGLDTQPCNNDPCPGELKHKKSILMQNLKLNNNIFSFYINAHHT